MRYVLDSCVAFKWVVPETDTDRAVRLRDAYRKAAHELLAPDIFPVEVAHALTRAERQGRIVVAQSGRLSRMYWPPPPACTRPSLCLRGPVRSPRLACWRL